MSTPSSDWSLTSVPVPVNSGRNTHSNISAKKIESNGLYQRHPYGMSSLLVPPGSIILFGGSTAPGGWLLCNGQEIDRETYSNLFEYIGTTYGSGDGLTTFKVPSLLAPSTGDSTIVTGELIDKDMYSTTCASLSSDYAPNNIEITSGSSTAFAWDDWANDIFDDWGYFYLFDPSLNQYHFILLQNNNLPDGVLTTQQFTAFGSRVFTVVHGYPIKGIFKFEISVNDSQPFIFGAYGDMGSDSDTENTNLDTSYSLIESSYTLYYNRNVEAGDAIERFFSYFIPFETSVNNTKTYSDYINGDELSLYSVPVNKGITVYFSKTNDVNAWIISDLQITDGYIRGGASTQGIPTSYIIKV